MMSRLKNVRSVALLVGLWLTLVPAGLTAAPLDEMSLERWAKVGEAERYQLQIAEKYYREKSWKIALPEYEKFLTLYEKSEAAPYAQMKWSICQAHLRKLNTAIKEGYQSVIDYWPDSPEAVASSYYIGATYKEMGETKKAKQAYANVLAKHGDHLVGVYARVDLIDIARVESDINRRVALWKELTFDTKRVPEANGPCTTASQQLAAHYFYAGAFNEGQLALATTYAPEQLPYYIVYFAQGPLGELTKTPESKAKGERLAQAAVSFIREKIPADISEPAKKVLARQYWFNIADLYNADREYEKVPEVYDQMTKTFGIDDEILGRLAQWYKGQNKREEARKTYARYENMVEGQNQIAYSHREEQKWDLAIAIYRTLSLQDPKLSVRFKGEWALTCRYAGKCDEAVAVYRELMTEDAAKANAWQWEIGNTYRDFGRHKEAIATYRLTDTFPEAYKQIAWCHRQLKEYKEALSMYYQVASGHKPSAPWAFLQVGYTQEQAGENEKAIKAFQQVCAKFPKSGEASEAHAYLQDKFKINATLGGATEE